VLAYLLIFSTWLIAGLVAPAACRTSGDWVLGTTGETTLLIAICSIGCSGAVAAVLVN
jgi:hypothetical protein